MTKKFTLALLFIGLFLSSCGDSDSNGFTESFRADENVTSSIFAHGANDDGHEPVVGDFRLKVVSSEVSSGFVKLNDEELLGPSDFHNVSFEQLFYVTLYDENEVEVEVRGSPGDQLCVRFYEVLEDESERGIFERCVDREAGPPNNVSVVITPTPTPTPTP
jgi:hypothetical protein